MANAFEKVDEEMR